MKIFRNLAGLAASTALFVGLTATALGHHSASQFNFGGTVNVTGVVRYVRFANPHAKIILEVTDDERGTRDIEYEGHSRNNYYRAGWRVGAVNPGDEITLIAAPTRDGTDGGYALGVITQDGVRF
jgi:hypothetical protein